MKRIKISGKVPNARKSVLTNHGNTKIQMETQNKLWKLKELGKELSQGMRKRETEINSKIESSDT